MTLQVEAIRPNFAAELRGIDISQPLAADVVHAVHEAIDQYGMIVFRGQTLQDEQQMHFASQFGPLERYSLSYGNIHAAATKRFIWERTPHTLSACQSPKAA